MNKKEVFLLTCTGLIILSANRILSVVLAPPFTRWLEMTCLPSMFALVWNEEDWRWNQEVDNIVCDVTSPIISQIFRKTTKLMTYFEKVDSVFGWCRINPKQGRENWETKPLRIHRNCRDGSELAQVPKWNFKPSWSKSPRESRTSADSWDTLKNL